MNLVKSIWPRLLLYVFLGILILCSVLYGSVSEHSSLSENFLAGSIEIAIMVILIDGLLSLERRRRIKSINAGNASEVRHTLGLIIVGSMREFSFPVEPSELTVALMSNSDLRKQAKKFFESKEYTDYLQDVKTAKKGMLQKIENLEKYMTEFSSTLVKKIDKSAPHPDPALVKLIRDTVPAILVLTQVVKIMYEMMEMVKNSKASDAALVKGILDKQMEELTTNKDEADDKNSMHATFRAFLNAMLNIHERAEKNALHYDI